MDAENSHRDTTAARLWGGASVHQHRRRFDNQQCEIQETYNAAQYLARCSGPPPRNESNVGMSDRGTSKINPSPLALPADYAQWLASLKQRIRGARQRALLAANASHREGVTSTKPLASVQVIAAGLIFSTCSDAFRASAQLTAAARTSSTAESLRG
jgi:hypothetical protein